MATLQPLLIDFANIEGPVYTGRDRGEQLRSQFQLDEADRTNRDVTVRIPADTYSVNSSFFLGLFGKSVVNSGAIDLFFQRVRFDGPQHILERLHLYAARALQEKDLFSN